MSEDVKLYELFKGIIDADDAPVVICNTESVIVYMNPSSVKRYGADLTGKSIKDCHNADSNAKIDRVLAWFAQSPQNNKVYTYRSDRENKDVYMVALRTGDRLIGYYEKHEYRSREESERYKI